MPKTVTLTDPAVELFLVLLFTNRDSLESVIVRASGGAGDARLEDELKLTKELIRALEEP